MGCCCSLGLIFGLLFFFRFDIWVVVFSFGLISGLLYFFMCRLCVVVFFFRFNLWVVAFLQVYYVGCCCSSCLISGLLFVLQV